MVKLNKQVEYSLICLRHMYSKTPGELTRAREIADKFGTPFDATSRSLQKLVQMGVLRSEQGPMGGYQITKDLSKVTLLDLMEGTLGKMAVVKCLTNSSCELLEKCNLVSTAVYLNHKVMNLYGEITLAELVRETNCEATVTYGHHDQESNLDASRIEGP